MATDTDYQPDKQAMRSSFGQAVNSYDAVAELQCLTADEMLSRLPFLAIKPQNVLDLGCGTGRNLPHLQHHYANARIWALDIAEGMLQHARRQHSSKSRWLKWLPGGAAEPFIAGDAEQLPFADNSFDLVFANLTLQWCEPDRSFAELQRVLKPGGCLMFSTLGPDTLTELRQAWAAVDDSPHVNRFLDMHDVGDAMSRSAFGDVVLDVDMQRFHFATVQDVMRSLKDLGAHNVNQGRRRSLTGKKRFQQMQAHYETFRETAGLPVSYEVVYGHGWAGELPQQQTADGAVHVPVSDIGRRS